MNSLAVETLRVGEAGAFGIGPADVTQFIDAHWKRRLAIAIPEFYDWQFRQAPASEGIDRSLVVVDNGGRISGFFGVTPREFRLNGQTCRGAEITTWVFAPETRGKGYGKAMLALLQERYDVVLGAAVNETAMPLFVRSGFRYIRTIPRFVRVWNLDALAPFSTITPVGAMLARQAVPPSGHGYVARPLTLGEAAPLAAWLHREFNTPSRDPAALEWRYLRHPLYRYEPYIVESSGGVALVILRRDQKDGLRLVHVLEAFGHREALTPAMQFVEETCREWSADVADFFCTSDRMSSLFRHHGWLSVVDDPWIQVPHLFFPIEMRTPPSSSLSVWSRADMGSLLQQSRLYLTKGDCDLDRPTLQWVQKSAAGS